METGYRTHYFSNDNEHWGQDLARLLVPGPTLDEELERICQAIRSWVSEEQSGSFRSLTIHLTGPMEGIPGDHKTPEEALAESKDQEERFYALGRAAKSRFDAGDYEAAENYALELRHITPSYRDNWNYGNAIASSNIVLGHLVLKNGQVDQAEEFLLQAGASPGSPQMNSFGPNMSLANDLLLAGRKEAVLEYFRLCESFWASESNKLDQWTEDVQQDRIPDFGANLVY